MYVWIQPTLAQERPPLIWKAEAPLIFTVSRSSKLLLSEASEVLVLLRVGSARRVRRQRLGTDLYKRSGRSLVHAVAGERLAAFASDARARADDFLAKLEDRHPRCTSPRAVARSAGWGLPRVRYWAAWRRRRGPRVSDLLAEL